MSTEGAGVRGDPKDEYTEVCENIRHWERLRFIQLTVFVAVMGGLLGAIMQIVGALSSVARICVKATGTFTVIVFWVMDERVVQYWKCYRQRAVELEGELGFRQYSTAPPRRAITAGNAVRLLFLVLQAFWITSLVLHSRF